MRGIGSGDADGCSYVSDFEGAVQMSCLDSTDGLDYSDTVVAGYGA